VPVRGGYTVEHFMSFARHLLQKGVINEHNIKPGLIQELEIQIKRGYTAVWEFQTIAKDISFSLHFGPDLVHPAVR
jgi:hypothetical protein